MSDSQISAKLTLKSGPGAGQVVELARGELIVGRVPPADWVINHPEISRRHARIFYAGGSYFVEDLGSSNGTYVNGEKNAAAQALSNGDQIRLGSEVTIVFGLPEA